MDLSRRNSTNRQWSVWHLPAALFLIAFVALGWNPVGMTQTAGQTSGAKPIGTIKSISGNAITLASDAGPVFNVSVEENAKILRIEPGAKDLKNAETMQLQELQAGDRILAVGKIAEDGHSMAATSVIVMKKADVASKQEKERQEWQRHGVGGLVTAVDPANGTITISTQSLAGSASVAIHTSKETILRRYSADSVKFDDAKPAPIDQIKPGDQLRARGSQGAAGGEMTADEVVSGAFRNIAGIVSAVDAAGNTVSVADVITKTPVTVKITPESQLRKLPPQMAQFMAMRLKGAPGNSASGAGSGTGGSGTRQEDASRPAPADRDANAGGGPAGSGRRGPGGGDLQQMLSRVPAATLADLQKGDAVMIVSTEGNGSSPVTAITLVAGVEPLLAASPNGGGQSMILPPWSFEAPGGEGAQ
jgi:hypothetical protein